MRKRKSIRPTRPATRPGMPTGLKAELREAFRSREIAGLFRERQTWGKPMDSLHNRVYGPKVGGSQ